MRNLKNNIRTLVKIITIAVYVKLDKKICKRGFYSHFEMLTVINKRN